MCVCMLYVLGVVYIARRRWRRVARAPSATLWPRPPAELGKKKCVYMRVCIYVYIYIYIYIHTCIYI